VSGKVWKTLGICGHPVACIQCVCVDREGTT